MPCVLYATVLSSVNRSYNATHQVLISFFPLTTLAAFNWKIAPSSGSGGVAISLMVLIITVIALCTVCYIVWKIKWHERKGRADLVDRDQLSRRFAIHYEHRREKFYDMAGPLLALTFTRAIMIGSGGVSLGIAFKRNLLTFPFRLIRKAILFFTVMVAYDSQMAANPICPIFGAVHVRIYPQIPTLQRKRHKPVPYIFGTHKDRHLCAAGPICACHFGSSQSAGNPRTGYRVDYFGGRRRSLFILPNSGKAW